jgi:hypothetical protein
MQLLGDEDPKEAPLLGSEEGGQIYSSEGLGDMQLP